MIAIAGSNGGCGKSTVTLGLAEAFARADVPTLAIDADRQLPNLHVMTDLEREPTLADLERGVDVRELAQEHPRSPAVGVVPAPAPSRGFEFDALGEHLAIEGTQVLVDCPAGAGPDVVDPLREADGVVVVAEPTDRGYEGATRTIELTRRLGVPVYGAVLNRCSSVPASASRLDDVPVLGCVPERTTPLLNDEVAAAFDDVVERLTAQEPIDPSASEPVDGRLPTGTPELDRRLGGGLPPGSTVALVANPASRAETLLYRATAVRGTLYLSTDRPRTTVRRAIDATSVRTGTPTIRRVAGEGALEETRTLVRTLPEAATLIVDPVDELERRDRSAYVSFLAELEARVDETDGVAILNCLESERRNRELTLRFVDAVFELEAIDADGDADGRLSVAKYRPDARVGGTVDLAFGTDGVRALEIPPAADGG